mmetsp:Transcript_24195/g.33178  ORF Transcript_24195/g.33178 Transcript_24195/m.33178 type:complete len:356 (-) Transcript_24195:331-1398(-)
MQVAAHLPHLHVGTSRQQRRQQLVAEHILARVGLGSGPRPFAASRMASRIEAGRLLGIGRDAVAMYQPQALHHGLPIAVHHLLLAPPLLQRGPQLLLHLLLVHLVVVHPSWPPPHLQTHNGRRGHPVPRHLQDLLALRVVLILIVIEVVGIEREVVRAAVGHGGRGQRGHQAVPTGSLHSHATRDRHFAAHGEELVVAHQELRIRRRDGSGIDAVARHDSSGRLSGFSVLLQRHGDGTWLTRKRGAAATLLQSASHSERSSCHVMHCSIHCCRKRLRPHEHNVRNIPLIRTPSLRRQCRWFGLHRSHGSWERSLSSARRESAAVQKDLGRTAVCDGEVVRGGRGGVQRVVRFLAQ